MANVRMPVHGEAFFEFVRGGGLGERSDVSYFPTYAHLLCTAAAFGLHKGEYDESPELKEKDPLPIPLETFKSQDLYNMFLILGIAHTDDPAIAKEEAALCRLVEGLASAGFRLMGEMYRDGGSKPNFWLKDWQDAVLEAAGADNTGEGDIA